MTGEEMRQYIKQSGVTLNSVAKELDMSPQNFNSRLMRKSLKADFIAAVKNVLDKCCPPLPAEMESAVIGSNVNGSNSSNVNQSIGSGNDEALQREVDLLREQNAFLQKQVETLLGIVGNQK